jgi:plasmid stabilization system protein ParE
MALYHEASQARDDLSAVIEFIAADNPDAAEGFLTRIASDYRRLAEAPDIGRDDRSMRRYMALAQLNAGYAVIDTGDPHDAMQMLSGEAAY